MTAWTSRPSPDRSVHARRRSQRYPRLIDVLRCPFGATRNVRPTVRYSPTGGPGTTDARPATAPITAAGYGTCGRQRPTPTTQPALGRARRASPTPSGPTRSPAAQPKAHGVDDHPPSTPTSIGTATPSNAASNGSNTGLASPPASSTQHLDGRESPAPRLVPVSVTSAPPAREAESTQLHQRPDNYVVGG
jgi:hypothetical protein